MLSLKKQLAQIESAALLTFAWTQILVDEDLQLPICLNQTSLLGGRNRLVRTAVALLLPQQCVETSPCTQMHTLNTHIFGHDPWGRGVNAGSNQRNRAERSTPVYACERNGAFGTKVQHQYRQLGSILKD